MRIIIDREESMELLKYLVERHNLNVVSTGWVNKKWCVEVQLKESYNTTQKEHK